MLIFTGKILPEHANSIPGSIGPYLVVLHIDDTYKSLSHKSFGMLNYVYKFHMDTFDWLIKADDDTYVIMENLKWFLSERCDRSNETYGHILQLNSDKYLSGGGGYVMSAEAVRKVGQALSQNRSSCGLTSGAEDIDMSRCLSSFGISPGESRDQFGFERFHAISYGNYLEGGFYWHDRLSLHAPKNVGFSF